MSNDAVHYLYMNVGVDHPDEPEAVHYLYLNVGSFGIRTIVGRVLGITHLRRHEPRYAYMNVLDVISGAARTMEDESIRHLEDGTTERTLE